MSKIIKIGQLLAQLIANNMSGCFFLKHGVVRSQLLIGFQDTGKRTQLSGLGVPA